MPLQLANLTFDCADPLKVSAFWAQAMDLALDDGASEFFVSAGRNDPAVSPKWFFAQVPEAKSTKNRLHIDLETEDMPAQVARLVELGATVLAAKDLYGHQWTVMSDVEGNEFCVSGPHAH